MPGCRIRQEGLIYSRPAADVLSAFPGYHEITISLPAGFEQTEIRFKDIKIIRPGAEIQATF